VVLTADNNVEGGPVNGIATVSVSEVGVGEVDSRVKSMLELVERRERVRSGESDGVRFVSVAATPVAKEAPAASSGESSSGPCDAEETDSETADSSC
jgi:hypothetical protein